MSTTARKEKVSTFFRPIQAITVTHIKQMYELYSSFYENTSLDIFLNDLSKKSGVILVSRKEDNRIVGFSTQTFFNLVVDGKRVRGIFSGDTIVEPAYWGNNALANTFYRRLIIERIKQPFVPFYWFLISKGYKTYLLMTNNFYNYYPKVNGNRPGMDERFRRITEAYCEALFPEAFDREKMVLDFGNTYVRLKGDVADITPATLHPDTLARLAAIELLLADGSKVFGQLSAERANLGRCHKLLGVFNSHGISQATACRSRLTGARSSSMRSK